MRHEADKDPNARLEYGFDWSRWLKGDVITASEWIVTGAIAISDWAGPVFNDTTTAVWISGGTIGEEATLVNRITTATGQKDDRTIFFRILER